MTRPKFDPRQMILDPDGLKSLKTTKRISSSGDSYILPITKEAKTLGLDKGDEITVIFENPYASNTHDYDLARMLANPNAAYVNSRVLTPDDRYIDGAPIEDLTDDMLGEDRALIAMQLEVWSRLNYEITNAVRKYVTCEYAWYSDSQRSFVQRFRNPRTDDLYADYLRTYVLLQLLDDLTLPETLKMCPLASVNSLEKHIIRAKNDAFAIYKRLLEDEHMVSSTDLEEQVSELNQGWEMFSTGRKFPDQWYVGVAIVGLPPEDDPEGGPRLDYRFGIPEFKMYKAPNSSFVSAQLEEEFYDSDKPDTPVDMTVFGPYESEDEARDVLSFLRIEHRKVGAGRVDQSFVSKCHHEVNKLFNN